MMQAVVLWALLLQDPAELLRRLESGTLEERTAAEKGLRDLGEAARPFLDLAAKDPDLELSRRAALLLRTLDLKVLVTPALREALPGVDDRLANGGDHEWTRVLLEAVPLGLGPRDLAFLAGRALRGARSPEERSSAFSIISGLKIVAALPDLLRILQEVDEAAGAQLARFLKNLDGPELRRGLADLVRGGKPAARGTACELLDELGAREAVPAIAELLATDDARLQRKALEALVHLDAKDRAPAVAALLKDKNPDTQEGAILALRRLGARDAALAAAGLLGDADAGTREAAANALGALKIREAAPALRKAVADPSDAVRSAALWALAGLGDAVPPDAFLATTTDPEPAVRKAAIWALGLRKAEIGGPAVKRALAEDEDLEVRALAAWAAAALNLREAGPALLPLLKERRADLRAAAAAAAGDLGVREAVPALLKVLADNRSGLDVDAAIAALGRLRAVEAIPSLLTPGDRRGRRPVAPELRPGAFDALRRLPAEDVVARAEALLAEKDPGKRRLGAQLLHAARGPALQARCLELLRDADEDVQAAAAGALGELGAKEAAPRLLEILNDEHSGARGAAGAALSLLGDPAALPVLRRLAQDPPGDMEVDVVRGLERFGDDVSRDFVLTGLTNYRTEGILAAGMWLCRDGRKAAIIPLLEDGEIFVPLNGLRRPEDWRRLCATRLEGGIEGTLMEIAARIGAAAGLTAELEPEEVAPDLAILLRRYRVPDLDGRLTAAEALLELIRQTEEDFEAILEPGRLRIVSWDEGRDFWKRWGAEALRSK